MVEVFTCMWPLELMQWIEMMEFTVREVGELLFVSSSESDKTWIWSPDASGKFCIGAHGEAF